MLKKSFVQIEDDNSSVESNGSKVKKEMGKSTYIQPWKRAEANPSLVKVGTEIHINPLPSDANHDELFFIFEKFGEIIDMRIIPRKDKGTCFAFIRFMDKESLSNALGEKVFFRGKPVNISKSKEETTIFIGNLNKNWDREYTESLLREKISKFDEFRFLTDPRDSSRNRGFCFVRYNNPVLAKAAYDTLTKNIIMDGRALTIDWSEDFSDEDVNRVQIHLSGLKEDVKTEDLFTVFSQYGQIVNLKLARDNENKGRKDYGFITYSSPDEATKAVEEFRSEEYFDYPIQIQFARKISSIIKHKQKVNGDMLEKKRNRDNQFRNSKRDKFEVNSEEEEEVNYLGPGKKRRQDYNGNSLPYNSAPNNPPNVNMNVNPLLTQFMNMLATTLNPQMQNMNLPIQPPMNTSNINRNPPQNFPRNMKNINPYFNNFNK